jgi:hypothetical protein
MLSDDIRWQELYRYLDSRFDQDPRMVADKERYEGGSRGLHFC